MLAKLAVTTKVEGAKSVTLSVESTYNIIILKDTKVHLVSNWKGILTHQSIPSLDFICKSYKGSKISSVDYPKPFWGRGGGSEVYMVNVHGMIICWHVAKWRHASCNWYFLLILKFWKHNDLCCKMHTFYKFWHLVIINQDGCNEAHVSLFM